VKASGSLVCLPLHYHYAARTLHATCLSILYLSPYVFCDVCWRCERHPPFLHRHALDGGLTAGWLQCRPAISRAFYAYAVRRFPGCRLASTIKSSSAVADRHAVGRAAVPTFPICIRPSRHAALFSPAYGAVDDPLHYTGTRHRTQYAIDCRLPSYSAIAATTAFLERAGEQRKGIALRYVFLGGPLPSSAHW